MQPSCLMRAMLARGLGSSLTKAESTMAGMAGPARGRSTFRQGGPGRLSLDGIGETGFGYGPCSFIIDVVGLSDPLLARLPPVAVPDLRVGHLFRNVPAGYRESLATDTNRLEDPAIHRLFAAVRLATRGPLLAEGRAQAIFDLALRQLGDPADFAAIRTPPFRRVSLAPGQPDAPFGLLTEGIDTEYYRMQHYEVSMLEREPVAHYRSTGWRDGWRPNPLFDPAWYLARHAAIVPAGTEPLRHYLETGWKQGLQPSAEFDPAAYLARNSDVAAAGVNPLLHYLETGWREGRGW